MYIPTLAFHAPIDVDSHTEIQSRYFVLLLPFESSCKFTLVIETHTEIIHVGENMTHEGGLSADYRITGWFILVPHNIIATQKANVGIHVYMYMYIVDVII